LDFYYQSKVTRVENFEFAGKEWLALFTILQIIPDKIIYPTGILSIPLYNFAVSTGRKHFNVAFEK
jgi:hypothetical protein